MRRVMAAAIEGFNAALMAEGRIPPRPEGPGQGNNRDKEWGARITARAKTIARKASRVDRLPPLVRKKLAALHGLWANGHEQETLVMAIEQAFTDLVDAGEIEPIEQD
jgi:hypothetical protein